MQMRWFFVVVMILVLTPYEAFASFNWKGDTAEFVQKLKTYPKANNVEKAAILKRLLRLYKWKSAIPVEKSIDEWLHTLQREMASKEKALRVEAFRSFGEVLEKLSFYKNSVKRKSLQQKILKLFPWKQLKDLCKTKTTRWGREQCFNLTWFRHRDDSIGLQAFESFLTSSSGMQQHALFFVSTQELVPSVKKQEPLAQLLLLYANRLTTERQITAMSVLKRLNPKLTWAKLSFYQHCLLSPYARSRRVAAGFLYRLGKDARPAMMLLWRLLKDKDDSVRRDATKTLGQLRLSKRVLRVWLSPMLRDKHDQVRLEALHALKRNQARPTVQSMPLLIKMSFGKDVFERQPARRLLPLYGKAIVPFLPAMLKRIQGKPTRSNFWLLATVLEKAGKGKELLPSLRWLLKQKISRYVLKKLLVSVKGQKKQAAPLIPLLLKKLSSNNVYKVNLLADALELLGIPNAKAVTLLKQKLSNKRFHSIRQQLAVAIVNSSPFVQKPGDILWLFHTEYFVGIDTMDRLSLQIMMIPIILHAFVERVKHRRWYQGTHPEKFPKLKPSLLKGNKKFATSCNKACVQHIQSYAKLVTTLYENKLAKTVQLIHKSKAHHAVREQLLNTVSTYLNHFALQRRFYRNDLSLKAPRHLCVALAQTTKDKQSSIRKIATKSFRRHCVSGKSEVAFKNALQTYLPTSKPTTRATSKPTSLLAK